MIQLKVDLVKRKNEKIEKNQNDYSSDSVDVEFST